MMSDLPADVVEAVAEAISPRYHGGQTWGVACDECVAVATAALTAALPAVEAQLREQIAQEIEARNRPDSWSPATQTRIRGYTEGLQTAARIVRGGATE